MFQFSQGRQTARVVFVIVTGLPGALEVDATTPVDIAPITRWVTTLH